MSRRIRTLRCRFIFRTYRYCICMRRGGNDDLSENAQSGRIRGGRVGRVGQSRQHRPQVLGIADRAVYVFGWAGPFASQAQRIPDVEG